MDDVRGTFGTTENTDHAEEFEISEASAARDGPPPGIGQDERRMQVRAYNHWAGLLGERNFPSIEELKPEDIHDFGANSVLLDFSVGIENPAVQYLGEKLGDECGAEGPINKLSDVPARSLLSRITDHYMQILANEAPIGFEAEFVNRDGASVLYRGILLPYSSDDQTIDFIYGVINWKEMASQATADELLLEIDQALEAEPVVDEDEAQKHPSDPVTEWASSSLDDFDELCGLTPNSNDRIEPAETAGNDDDDVFELGLEQIQKDELPTSADNSSNEHNAERSETASLLDIRGCDAAFSHEIDEDLDLPDFDQYKLEDPEEEEFESGEDEAAYHFASLADYLETPEKKAIDLDAEVEMKTPHGGQAGKQQDAAEDQFDPSNEPQEEAGSLCSPELDDVLDLGSDAFATDDAPTNVEPHSAPALGLPDTSSLHNEDGASDEQTNNAGENSSSLYDHLASARELAHNALATEDRSRQALYAAVSRAYDFSLATKEEPEVYQDLISESGLTVQERAPMTPIVKLVFGSEYDKTRLTEYASVLSHAHRLELAEGSLCDFLAKAEGGLKGVVQAERRLRREESGKVVEPKEVIRAAIADKLRELEELALEQLSADGPEFALVVVRRDGEGGIGIIGEIDDDLPLIERAAKKLVS